MSERTIGRDDPRIPDILERVRHMARAIARRVPPSVQLDDLIAAGNLGVASALARYGGDPDTFEHYAVVHARGAMLDELRRLDTMSRQGRKLARRAMTTSRKLATRLGRDPADAEVAAEMGLKLDVYREIALQSACGAVHGLDSDQFAASESPADEQLDIQRRKARVSTELANLPGRHADVLAMSFECGATLQTIAQSLGISVTRAHQIRGAALKKLRLSCAADTELPSQTL